MEPAPKTLFKMVVTLTMQAATCPWESINLLLEMCQKTAKKAKMNEDKLKAVLTNVQADLHAVEEALGIKLGPKSNAERKHANFTNNFLLSFMESENVEAKKALIESAKLRQCIG
jgi:hypothetical protein